MSVARIKKDFRDLPVEDKIRLVQELWDEIEDPGAALPLTPEQQAEIEARYRRYQDNPSRALSWEEVEARYERSK